MRVAAVARVASPRIDARRVGYRVARPSSTFTAARATGDAASPASRGLRSLLGLASDDDLGWTHVLSSPEGREMAGMSPRELSTRMLALRDALATLAPDLDVAAMVTEQPGLVLYDGDADDVARETSRVWGGLERAMGGRTPPRALEAHAGPRRVRERVPVRVRHRPQAMLGARGLHARGGRQSARKPLAEWIFSGKPTDSWFGVFGACVGSEWGYLKTMEAYATKSVEGTSLASFRKQSAYINKNKQLRPQTSHVRAPVATPPRRS